MNVAIFCIEKDKSPNKTREFHDTAKRVEQKFADYNFETSSEQGTIVLKFINDGRSTVRFLNQWPGHFLDRIILIGHGTPLWWGLPGKMGIYKHELRDNVLDAETFAKMAKVTMKPSGVIVFASCFSGASPAWYRRRIFGDATQWGPQSHGVGGKLSLAGKVATISNREVRAHTTVGHTTQNPCIRIFTPGNNQGISVSKYMYGINLKTWKERAAWNKERKGEWSENVLIGLESLNV